MTFLQRLEAAQKRTNSTLAVGLAPELKRLPYQFQSYDEPFLPFSTAMIDATADLVCAYVFHLGAYLVLGAAGAIALERAIGYTPSHLIKILHGPFVGEPMVRAAFDGFGVDVVTLPGIQAEGLSLFDFPPDPERGFLFNTPPSVSPHNFAVTNPPGFQGGSCIEVGPRQYFCLWADRDKQFNIHWYDDIIYASPGADFREAAHRAAERVRQPFTLQTRPNQ